MASLLGRLSGPLEAGIRDLDRRQRFRRLQHRIFGLNTRQWAALETYLSGVEAAHIIVQRDGWLFNEAKRLKRMSFGLPANSPESQDNRLAYLDICDEVKQNRTMGHQTVKIMQDAKRLILHTPIFRALRDSRNELWFTSPGLQSRCIELGGCCSRGCGCCYKPRTTGIYGWEKGSHCTPACACCGRYNGLIRPIDNLELPRELTFDVNPDKTDVFSNMMMNNLVWNIKGAT